jgi:hypothetical protein
MPRYPVTGRVLAVGRPPLPVTGAAVVEALGTAVVAGF